MNFINKMKKNKKGFTLVEIIVVLVILAILAAFTIPTMLGFVEEAKGKAMIAEARMVYVAAQATATEYTANGDNVDVGELASSTVLIADPATNASKTMKNYLKDDFELGGTSPSWTVAWAQNTETSPASIPGKVGTVTYTKDGYTITLNAGGTTTVVKN